jgi:hypothetical protein
MLLGEHFKNFVVFVVCSCYHPFSDGTMAELLEGEEDEEGDATINTHW